MKDWLAATQARLLRATLLKTPSNAKTPDSRSGGECLNGKPWDTMQRRDECHGHAPNSRRTPVPLSRGHVWGKSSRPPRHGHAMTLLVVESLQARGHGTHNGHSPPERE